MSTSLESLGANSEEISSIRDITADAAQIKEAAKNSLDFLAALALPLVYQFAYPPVLLSAWDWLTGKSFTPRTFPKLALGLPRGFSKTTLMKLFILYCILFSKKKFILVIAANASLAENILADVIDMLEEPNIKKVFGDWRIGVEKDTQALKKFSFCGRTIILAGLGAGGSLRGLNLKNERPDIMVFEDIQTREQAESQIQSEALEKWMLGTAMKAKSPFGCTFIFLANMYPTKWSILKKLKYNSTWTKFIAGGILEDGTSLWEELFPIEQLMEEFQADLESGHPEIFYSEVLNDENATTNNLIDLSLLPPIPYSEGDTHGGNFIIIDPASGKLNSDAVSIGYFEIHDTAPVMMEVKDDRYSPGDTIREALEIALRKNCTIIAIESNAYQSSLCYWFAFICQQMGIIGIEPVEVYSGTASKNSRILNMFKSYAKGELFIHPDARAAAHLQISQFNALKKNNIDGILDLLTYAPKVIELYGAFITNSTIISLQQLEHARVLSAEDTSCF